MIDGTWYIRPEYIPERRAAGGVVVRVVEESVFVALGEDIKRPGLVLPKGGVDDGESPLDAARREIAEETGFTSLRLLCELGQRDRLSFDRSRWVSTVYFLFLTDELDASPREATRHFPPIWVPIDDVPPMLWPEQHQLIEANRQRIIDAATLYSRRS